MKNKNIPHYVVIDNPFTKLNEEKEFSLHESKMDMIGYNQDKDTSNLNESVIRDKNYSIRKNNLTISKNLNISSRNFIKFY